MALHWATRKGEDTSSSASTPIQVMIAENKEKLYNNILAHILFGIPRIKIAIFYVKVRFLSLPTHKTEQKYKHNKVFSQ